MYGNKSISQYLKELASNNPVPGGGSAAALAGATAAALLSKVVNFTVGKEKYKAVEKEMADILARSEALRENFTQLASEDAVVYKKLSDAFKLPKDKGERRTNKIQDALKAALAVPLEVCNKALEAIKFCLPVVEKGNANLITDTFIAGIMFNSAFHAAVLNVEINLKSIKDAKIASETRKIVESAEKEIAVISKKIQDKIDKYVREEGK
ncbi:MAG: cyclodeaminase/cyclohydrolase family protein [Candidatus Omnitrophota bacterium]